jgi:hypothetical protein
MAAPTFHHALEQAELLARQALPTVLHERLSCAVALVKAGKVLQRDDGHTWDVDSTTTPGLTYSMNGHGCQCEDAHYRASSGRCKHVLATLLAKKAMKLMHETPEETQEETPRAPHPSAQPVAALPEAPASVNVHLQIAGRQVQLTLRDTDETRLLARLQAVLAQYPLPQTPVQASSQGEGWCSLHAVPMQRNEKEGRTWWSHKTDQGWCKGKGAGHDPDSCEPSRPAAQRDAGGAAPAGPAPLGRYLSGCRHLIFSGNSARKESYAYH